MILWMRFSYKFFEIVASIPLSSAIPRLLTQCIYYQHKIQTKEWNLFKAGYKPCLPLWVTFQSSATSTSVWGEGLGLVQQQQQNSLSSWKQAVQTNGNAKQNYSKGAPCDSSQGGRAQWLRALTALPEDPGSIPSTHMVAPSHLHSSSRAPPCSLLALVGTKHKNSAQTKGRQRSICIK